MDDSTKSYIDWLNSHISSEKVYHHHKETMAWVATALYLPTIIGLGRIIGDSDLCCWINGLLTLIIVLACFVFLVLFINMQFAQRWKTAERTKIYSEFIVQFLAGEDSILSEEDSRIMSKIEDVAYPKFIAEQIESRYKLRCFRQNLLLLLKGQWHRLDDRWKTEFASYIMVITASIMGIIFIWCM